VFCIATKEPVFTTCQPGNGPFNLSVEPGQLLAPALLIPALDLCSGMVSPADWVLFVASAIAAHISGHYCGAMEQFQPVSHQLTELTALSLMSLSRWTAAILFMCGGLLSFISGVWPRRQTRTCVSEPRI
jgi:hypothetical protein